MSSLMRTVLRAGPKPSPVPVCVVVQRRGIIGRTMRASLPPRPPKPKPFDYVNKDYTWIRSLFDRTSHRLDENSKIVVVEAPIAAGKSEFAAKLADELEMKHFPEPTMDYHYIQNGVNLRCFNDQVPPDTRCFDEKDFCMNPTDRLAGAFQIMMFVARYSQYIDALVHLLNTGQGCVLERCVFSDYVFMEAMTSREYISRGVRSVYYDVRNNSIDELMRPHLIVYLDVPVPEVLNKIKCRNRNYEVKGKALTKEYLCEMERLYKHKYLKELESHTDLLVYDWSCGGDVEVVVEDIERIEMDVSRHRLDPKHKDWRMHLEWHWSSRRARFTNFKDFYMNMHLIPRLDVPELITSGEDNNARDAVVRKHPMLQYLPGYNPGEGASSLFLKNSSPKYFNFP